MNFSTQSGMEEEYIKILLDYPQKIYETHLTPKHFKNNAYKQMFSWMLSSEPDEEEGWDFVSASSVLPGPVFTAMGVMIGESVATSIFGHLEQKLNDSLKLDLITEKYKLLSNGEIDVEQYLEQIEPAIRHTTENVKNLSPDEVVELITSDIDVLPFVRYPSFRVKVPMERCHTHVLAGYTSRGKSALAANFAADLSRYEKVLYFNLEMTEADVWKRLVAMQTEIQINDMKKLKSDDCAREKMAQAVAMYQENGLKIYTGSKSLEQIKAEILRQSIDCIPVVIIDHLQCIGTEKRNLSEREQLNEIMKVLNSLAKDGKCTPILLSQINRAGSEEATLNNLHGSSAIAQYADTVLILEYEEQSQKDLPVANIIVKASKVRGSQTGKLKFRFDKRIQTFFEIYEE